MAGKRRKSGSASAAKPDYFPPKMLGVETKAIGQGWESAKALFDYRKADAALRAMLGFGDVRLAGILFIAGGLLASMIIVLANIEYYYVKHVKAGMEEAVIGQPVPIPDMSLLLPAAIANFMLWVPFMVIMNMAVERAGFAIARLTGGKATLGQQLTLVSVVWLAIPMTLAANMLAALEDCFSIISMAAIAVLGVAYLMVYMSARAYSIAHGITMVHALSISILLAIARIALLIFITDAAQSLLMQWGV